MGYCSIHAKAMQEPERQDKTIKFPHLIIYWLLRGIGSVKTYIMEFYILHNNTKQGPYSLDELKGENIDVDTMVWSVGFSNWKPAKNVPELSDLLSSLPPTPPLPKPMPKTWLVESILITCFCCIPFGIIGIVNATKIENLYLNNEYERAFYHSQQAKKWTLWGFFTALVLILLYIIGLIIIFTLSNL